MKVFISRLYLNYSRRNSRFPAQISSLLFEGLLHGIVWAHQEFKISCPDFFPALRRSFTRDCMGTSVILSIFSQTCSYSLQNQIFLTVSNNYLILNRNIQGGIRQTWIFRTPLGGQSGSHHMGDNVGRLILRLANTSFLSNDIKKLSK